MSSTSKLIGTFNSQPAAGSLKEVELQLARFWRSSCDYLGSYQPIHDKNATVPDSSLSNIQMLSLAAGFVGADTNAPLSARTYTLVYVDPTTAKTNYQTIGIPDYREVSPLFLTVSGNQAMLQDRSRGNLEIARTSVHARIRGASNHYYSRVGPNFRELPTSIIISPYTSCAGGCFGCSRSAVNSFVGATGDYIVDHVVEVGADFARRGWSRSDLVSVNVATGTQPTEEKELAMMLALVAEYRRKGFTNARFHVYSYNLSSRRALEALRAVGVMGFVGTIETMNDSARQKLWGVRKGAITFKEHLERYRLAREVGFPIVETNYILGADSYAEMMAGIDALDAVGVAVIPNIMRNYSTGHLASTHQDLWRMNLSYISDGFNACLRTYSHGTIKRRAARLSVEWLHRQGLTNVSVMDLPIRHT